MIDDIERLKEVGIEQIHNDTHIARDHIEAILNRDFEKLDRVQYLGFISIIEREYDINLNDEKAIALEFFNEKESLKKANSVFVVVEDEQKSKLPYIILIAIIFTAAVFFTLKFNSSSKSDSKLEFIDKMTKDVTPILEETPKEKTTLKIEPKKDKDIKKIEKQVVKKEEKKEIVKKDDFAKVEVAKKEKQQKNSKSISKNFIIKPKSKLWIGYIDLTENRKYQRIITQSLALDASKEWLLFLGHSFVTFNVDGKDITFKSKDTLRVLYKDRKFKKITSKEFKKLNKGHRW